MNLAASILVLGGGAILVWSGIQDPAGGVTGEIGRVLRGEPTTKKSGGSTVSSAIQALWSVGPTGGGTGTGSGGGTAQVSTTTGGPIGARIVAAAETQIGVPYVWGGETPRGPGRVGAMDCSGLVWWCLRQVGLPAGTPRVAEPQRIAAQKLSAPAPGDCVFFGIPASHVGIVTGPGQMIHAPRPGRNVTRDSIDSISIRPVSYGRLHREQAGPVRVA